jgi:hypothetical protein
MSSAMTLLVLLVLLPLAMHQECKSPACVAKC